MFIGLGGLPPRFEIPPVPEAVVRSSLCDKGADFHPLAPRKRGEGQGEGFPLSPTLHKPVEEREKSKPHKK